MGWTTNHLNPDDFRAVNPLRRVPSADHKLGVIDDLLVIVGGMVGQDDHSIVLPKIVEGLADSETKLTLGKVQLVRLEGAVTIADLVVWRIAMLGKPCRGIELNSSEVVAERWRLRKCGAYEQYQ